MSKIKELFGVEIKEKFDIKSEDYGTMENCYFCSTGALHVPDTSDFKKLNLMGELLIGDAKIVNPILTDEEREYLKAVCNPKFRVEIIRTITKTENSEDTYYLYVDAVKEGVYLFTFDKNLFKGMEEDKEYTPEELGLQYVSLVW